MSGDVSSSEMADFSVDVPSSEMADVPSPTFCGHTDAKKRCRTQTPVAKLAARPAVAGHYQHIDDGAQDGEYHIVVHVWNSGRSLRGSEVQVLISLRGGSSLVTVIPTAEVLESSCDEARCSGSNCCY